MLVTDSLSWVLMRQENRIFLMYFVFWGISLLPVVGWRKLWKSVEVLTKYGACLVDSILCRVLM